MMVIKELRVPRELLEQPELRVLKETKVIQEILELKE